MAKKLKMVFKNEQGKTNTLAPSMASESLTAVDVQTTMNAVAEIDLFEKDNVLKFKVVDNAYYTETIKTQLF